MQLPLQITFRNMEPSHALEARIQELAGRLDKFSARIMRCHVVVEAPSKQQHQKRYHLHCILSLEQFRQYTNPGGEANLRSLYAFETGTS